MAEIHLRRNDHGAAAGDLENFLKYHPDWPRAAKMREQIEAWRKEERRHWLRSSRESWPGPGPSQAITYY